MSTKADKIMSEIAAVETERAALIARQQAVEAALAQPGAAPELATELVTLGARIKAGAVKLLDLAQRKQDAEHAALLQQARQRLGELYAAQAELAALDAEIQTHQHAIARLTEARRPVEEQQRMASGRLARLHQQARAVGLGGELMAMRADMDKAQRMTS